MVTTCTATPIRVVRRPDPALWDTDELMTLSEATALFWPDGPLTVRSLRTAIRDRRLPVSVIAGKHFVTKRALAEMSTCTPLTGPAPDLDRPTPASAGEHAPKGEAYRRLMQAIGRN